MTAGHLRKEILNFLGWRVRHLDGWRELKKNSTLTSAPKKALSIKFSGMARVRNVPVTPTPSIFRKVLPYKWGAYCRTNGRRTAVQMGGAGFPFLRSLEAKKVRRYRWRAYCRTNWRFTAVLFRQVVGVGVSETLPTEYGWRP